MLSPGPHIPRMTELIVFFNHRILHFVLVTVVHHTDNAEDLFGGLDDGGLGYAVGGLDGDLEVALEGGGGLGGEGGVQVGQSGLGMGVPLVDGLELDAFAEVVVDPFDHAQIGPPHDLQEIHEFLDIDLPQPPTNTLGPRPINIPLLLIKPLLQVPIDLPNLGQTELILIPLQNRQCFGVLIICP